MKLSTALRYAHEVARRARSVNGLLATPRGNMEAVRISRIWVFGSTVKGSLAPNDLDLLIEARQVGRVQNWRRVGVDRRYLRSYGVRKAPDARNQMLIWLTRNMRGVSRHLADVETVDIDKRVLIYPRNDLLAPSTKP